MAGIIGIVLPVVVAALVVLALVVLVIRKLLIGEARRALAKITEVEADVRKREDAMRHEMEEHEKDLARRRTDAEEEISREKEKAVKEAAKLRDKLAQEAKAEGEEILADARRNEEKYRQQLALGAESKAVDYGAKLFQMVFSENVTGALNGEFIKELAGEMRELDTTNITVTDGETVFTTSHELAPEHRKVLEEAIKETFGVSVTVEEKIDPELLAGIIINLGSLELDASLRTRFRDAAEEVKKTASA